MELSLLRGKPIYVEQIGYIHPLTLGEIEEIGLIQYNLFLVLTTFDTSIMNFNDFFEECRINKELANLMCWALSLCLKDKVFFDGNCFRTDKGGCITSTNYLSLVEVIKKQYELKNVEVEEGKYDSEKAREIAEKIKARRSKIGNNNKEKLTLLDIISGVAARHPSINLFNIWDLTVYQLYDQFKRLSLIDYYHGSFFLMPYSEDIGKNLKHWSISLKEDGN